MILRKELTRLKRLYSALLALVLAALLCTGAFAASADGFNNFQAVNTYSEDSFGDVSGWYAPHVAAVYSYGLMQGTVDKETGERMFSPNGHITLAETVTLAARIHSTYTGDGFVFVQGAPWYQTYVDYAVENGILSSADEYDSYLQSVSRAQFADIMAHALPESAYAEINLVEQGAIPDVDMSQNYSFSVYTLYRAGVLTGGEHAAFRPDDCITRAEAAAVAGRIIDPSLRQSLQLYAPLYVGFTKDDANEGAVVITGLTMSAENGTCYLTMDFDSQKSRFLSIMNASESLYILQVVVIDPGVDHFTFAFPIETLEEIYTSSPNPANERLTMEFYASGDPSSVMDRFYISIDQFEKYFKKSA